MQTASTLYQKIGGKHAVERIVDDFYDRVLNDDTVNYFFAHTDMKKQRQHQTAFISYALGGPEYTERSMEIAHQGLNLQPEHFDAIVKHLDETLVAYGVSSEDINTVNTQIGSLKEAILYK